MKKGIRYVLYILAYLAFVLLFCGWFQALYNLMYPEDGWKNYFNDLFYIFPPILLLFAVNTLIVFKATARFKLAVKFPLDLLLSLSATVLVNLFYILVIKNKVDWGSTIINVLPILLINEVVFYIIHLRRSKKKEEEALLTAAQLQYNILKSQINPHFLFNSFNILYSLTTINPEKARDFTGTLAQMYRYIMAQQNKESVSAAGEMEFLSYYVGILQMRHHNCFSVETEEEAPLYGKALIPYSMQLIIENVTKHNTIQTDMPMTVSVTVTGKGIRISNPIHPKIAAPASEGIGLQYLGELYRNHKVEGFSVDNDGRTFTVFLPFLPEKA